MSGQEIKWERPNGEQGKGHRDWNEAVLTYNRDGVLRFNDRGVHRYDVCVNLWIPYSYAHNTGFAKEILLPLSHLAIVAAHANQIRAKSGSIIHPPNYSFFCSPRQHILMLWTSYLFLPTVGRVGHKTPLDKTPLNLILMQLKDPLETPIMGLWRSSTRF